MRPRLSPRRWLAGPLALLALLALTRGCSGSDDSPPVDPSAGTAGFAGSAGAGRAGAAGKPGKAGAGGKPNAGAAGSLSGGAAGDEVGGGAGSDAGAAGGYPGPVDCGDFTPPPTVPPGWVEYKDWSCFCRLYRPPTADLMPPPIQWDACPEPVDPSLSCQRMTPFWVTPGRAAVDIFPKVWPVPGSSTVLVQFSRLHQGTDPDVRYHLIAEADGPVRHALLQVNPVEGGCYLAAEGLREGKYLWRMSGDTWDVPGFGTVEGFLAGDLADPLPAVVVKQPKEPGLGSNWDVSADWLIQKKGPRFVRSWDKPTEPTLIHSGAQDPDGFSASIVVPQGPAVLLGIGEAYYHGISVWTQAKGVQPLQRWSGDYTRGAGNIGTDGHDLVWTYGEGKKPGDVDFPATSVFTAPYATDMATVEATKRRLRSDVTAPGDDRYRYAVGCGYAARRYFQGGQTSNLLIVRLSDGRGWKLEGKPGGPDKLFWGEPIGISCEHLYTSLSVKDSAPIVRIPLSSLGPGLPAD